ncbi:hypothetical protein OAJ43_03220 [Nitrosomonadales bacterium]|nr:hypothetical protein [Nitrosomonadales bacterium]
MKKLHYIPWVLLLLSLNLFGKDFQYHIYERYYNYHESMRPSPYGDLHVFLQGPMIEKAIEKNLKLNAMKCKAGINSKYIFSIEPQVFYNPSSTTLHGKFKIKIFTSENILQDTHIIKAQRQGRINQKANFYINEIYDKLITKLANEIINKLPKNNANINGDFCTIIEINQPNDNNEKKEYKRPIQA